MKKLLLCLLLAAGTTHAQQLTTESRAVLVETLQNAAGVNCMYAGLFPESQRYFTGRAEAYAAAAILLRDYKEPAPTPPPRPKPVNGRVPYRKGKQPKR